MSDEINVAGRQDKFFAAFDPPGSAAVLPERAAPNNAIENEIVIDADALPYLVGERKALAEEIARIMRETAAQHGLRGEIRISKKISYPEYGLTKFLEISQKLTVSSKPTRPYHDQFWSAIDAWANALPESLEKMLDDDILFDIEGDFDAPANG